ncbi:MAG: response regulator transcription factor [Gemmatimonadaceae bacterium]
MTRILVIEDNEDLARGLVNNLEIEGFETFFAFDGFAGLASARQLKPDLVILDLMLPLMDGYQVLAAIRDEGNTVPILILTARSAELDIVRGFRDGADDYLTKPFGILELLSRVQALLRRSSDWKSEPRPAARVTFGAVVVEPATHDVFRRGEPVSLRPKEFELLMALLRRRGEIAARLDLLREVWGYGSDVVSRTVDTHIAELRRKLEDDPAEPRYILTVRKSGYRLSASWSSPPSIRLPG